jgi:hypothetical protein
MAAKPRLTDKDLETILHIRLLVARAAQPDGLRWWGDRSLTPEGGYITERLFARRPKLAAAKIALESARGRHAAVMRDTAELVHLFDLGEDTELELSTTRLDEVWVPGEPYASRDDLMSAISRILPDGVGCAHGEPGEDGKLLVGLGSDVDRGLHPIMLEVGALASAYGAGGIGRPVFPFLKRTD